MYISQFCSSSICKMDPPSLLSLSSRVVSKHVYYVNELDDFVADRFGLIPISDIKKLHRSTCLSKECGDEYFMKYLFDNPIRGILFAARYGILSLFEIFKKSYIENRLHIRRFRVGEHVCLPFQKENVCPLFSDDKNLCRYVIQNGSDIKYVEDMISTNRFGKNFWHHEAQHTSIGLSLSTVAALGGNVDIVKEVCSIENKLVEKLFNDEMMMYAVMYGRIDVVNFLLCYTPIDNQTFWIVLFQKALDANASTDMLVTIFPRFEESLIFILPKLSYLEEVIWLRKPCLLPESDKYVVYLDVLIEFGFRRVITYNDMIFPDEFAHVDLSCENLRENNKNNKLFIYALYNNVLINHGECVDFALALAIVCMSRKSSVELLHKLYEMHQSKFNDDRWRSIVNLSNAVNYVIYSMTKHISLKFEKDFHVCDGRPLNTSVLISVNHLLY